jgi:hypothetical protein
MDTSVQVAVISAAASVSVAAISYVLTVRQKRSDDLRRRKLHHYRELLCAISDLAVDDVDKMEANKRFARAANTIALVAPQQVIRSLMDFHEEVRFSNPSRTQARHDELLVALLLAIRASLELPLRDDPTAFRFHLIGARPSRGAIAQPIEG